MKGELQSLTKKRPLDPVDILSEKNKMHVRSRFNSRERDMVSFLLRQTPISPLFLFTIFYIPSVILIEVPYWVLVTFIGHLSQSP